MTSPVSRITELAKLIAEKTAIVEEYFQDYGIPTPSFDINGPRHVSIPPQVRTVAVAHADVLSATRELHNLMLGPSVALVNMTPNDVVSLQAISRFNIAKSFPVGQEASFEDISKECGLNVIDLKRLLRLAMTNQIFHEPRKGIVAHTAASRLLADDEGMRDYIGMRTEELFPATAKIVDAATKYGQAQNAAQCGFSLAHGTDLGMYDFLQQHPERSARYGNAMNFRASKIPLDPIYEQYDWKALGKATVVDVGGAYGAVCFGLAQRFPDLTFIVQDFANIVQVGAERVPSAVKDRVHFMPYDVFTEQPAKGAALYFFRAIFHNWPDACCVDILRNQIPALAPGSRILINEMLPPDPHTKPPFVERNLRSIDIGMLAIGGAERGPDEWQSILDQAGPHFKITDTKQPPPGSVDGLIEVVWNG